MKIEDDILIEKYLRNQLSKNEIIFFKEKLLNDNDFREKYNFEKKLFKTLNINSWYFIKNDKYNDINEYKDIFNSDEIKNLRRSLKSINKKQNLIKFDKKWIYLVASIFVFIMSLNYFLLNSANKLFDNYYDLKDLPSIVNRSGSQNTLQNAQELFNNKHYEEALNIFEDGVNIDSTNIALYIFIGISQMELKQYDESLNTFNKIITNKELITTKGNWFKALLYLKMKDFKNAKLTLQEINKNDFKYKEAQKILKKLN